MSIYFGSLEDELSEVVRENGDNKEMTDITTATRGDTLSTTRNTAGNTASGNAPPTASNTEFDRRNLAKTLQIPTDDPTVRSYLILLNQPITLFGEGPGDRRDRLRMMASRAIFSLPGSLDLFPVLKKMLGQQGGNSEVNKTVGDESESDDEEFYVPGSIDLIKVRSFLLKDSISRSRSSKSQISFTTELSERTTLNCNISKYLDLRKSLVDPEGRPFSSCLFTEFGDLVTGDFSGKVVVRPLKDDFEGNKNVLSVGGDRITAMCSGSNGLLMTGNATGVIQVYHQNYIPSATLTHDTKFAVKSLNLHPSSSYFASTSLDSLWRLWDIQQGSPIQIQEGHVGGISSGAWHPHGSIYCTGGSVDGIIRVWDCRVGKSVWNVKIGDNGVNITSLAFSPQSSNLLASSTADGLISFHDLRKLEASYTKIAAHRSSCTSLKFASNGRLLVSSGFDGHLRIWSPGDLRLVKELPVTGGNNTGKVMDMDVFNFQDDGNKLRIAAVTFDKFVKIFSQ